MPLAAGLARHGDKVALVTGGDEISYRELADRADRVADRYGDGRKLVLIAATNELDPLVAYLAALRAGHPVMLVPAERPAHVASLVARYDPDVVVAPGDAGWGLSVRRASTAHELHPDLALLLCTSGSTGSPKLVRLSHTNLQANAEAIAQYLGIDATDRAVTSLPFHYCYGLSVVHSHLLRGAGLVLTDASVIEDRFWDAFRSQGATSFAGVPYTFDLLDRIGFASMAVPGLRYVTQAGGRLPAERVRRYAELAERDGWRFYVMYGQTEATARMAYLPPELARTHPGAIGVPIPGGSFELAPLDDSEDAGASPPSHDGDHTGELVYRGPNVMLGYAEQPADLALGATVDALRTGDIARRTPDGLYEIVGRRSHMLKIFGLRIDLRQVEDLLDAAGIRAVCTGDDEALLVAVGPEHDPAAVRRVVEAHTGLPPSRVRICPLPEIPRLPNGKPDRAAISAVADGRTGPVTPPDAVCGPTTGITEAATDPGTAPSARGASAATTPAGDPVRALFRHVLGVDDVDPDASFVDLGGDSLSYVEMSVRLEELLGTLPADWHTTPIRRLPRAAPARRGRLARLVRPARVETNVVLRALAIVFVVGTHAGLLYLPGGAHLLLGVAGFNFARFQLASGRLVRSIARIAVPSAVLIGVVAAARDGFGLSHVLLVHGPLHLDGGGRWRFWFIEALVHILVVLALVLAVPALRRLERRHRLGFPAVILAVGLAVRFDLVPVPATGHPLFRPHEVLWLFAVGWLAAQATRGRHRLVAVAAVVLAVPGFFPQPERAAVVTAGLLALAWVPRVPVPWPVNRLMGLVASASLYIYLTHSEVYPLLLDHGGPAVGVAVALVVGIGVWAVAQRATTAAEAAIDRVRLGRGGVPTQGNVPTRGGPTRSTRIGGRATPDVTTTTRAA